MPFAISSAMFRTDALHRLGGFDESLDSPATAVVEDMDLMIRVAKCGEITMLDEVLGSYRVHAASTSAKQLSSQRMGSRYLEARERAAREGNHLEFETWRRENPRTSNQKRKDFGAGHYRAAGAAALEGRYSHATWHMFLALLARPRYVSHRLVSQHIQSP